MPSYRTAFPFTSAVCPVVAETLGPSVPLTSPSVPVVIVTGLFGSSSIAPIKVSTPVAPPNAAAQSGLDIRASRAVCSA